MNTDKITRPLVAALVRKGALAGDHDGLMAIAGESGCSLVTEGFVSEKVRLETLAELLHLDFVELSEDFRIPDALLDRLSAELIKQYQFVPVSEDDGVIRVALAYPYDAKIEDIIHRKTGAPVKLALCDRERIQAVLKRSNLDRQILRDVSVGLKSANQEDHDRAGVFDLSEAQADPVVKLLNQILSDAIGRRCSDIHVESEPSGVGIKYRVDGVLLPSDVAVGDRFADQLVSRIKVMADLDISEKQKPQDGRFRLSEAGVQVDVRVSVVPTSHGEDVVMRLLDQNAVAGQDQSISLMDLGLTEAVMNRYRDSIHEPFGLILLTGPTGSGKTTSLYAALSETNSGLEKIITVEDPVEYQLPGIVQIPVNEKKGLTFAKGLRAILRHDPDKIMIGEIRDAETAEIAVQAALTGHLVFSTVHANTTLDVVGRIHHMGVDRHNFVSSLKCILGQRLMRRVCPHCHSLRAPEERELLLFKAQKLPPPEQLVEPGRCERCDHTGYKGRFAVAEFIYFTPELKQMFIDQASFRDIADALEKQEFSEMRSEALKRAAAGDTTMTEVERTTQRGML